MNPTSSSRTSRAAALVLAAALFECSCAQTPTHTETQGGTFGAVLGAGIGAIIGHQFGDKNGAAIGAAVGALLGGAAGVSWAKQVETARQNYRTEEERLAATLEASKQIQEQLEKENAALAAKVARHQEEVAQLRAQVAASQTDTQVLQRKKAEIDKERANAEATRIDLEKAIALEEDQLAQANAAHLAAATELEQRIDTQRTALSALLKSETELVNLSATLGA